MVKGKQIMLCYMGGAMILLVGMMFLLTLIYGFNELSALHKAFFGMMAPLLMAMGLYVFNKGMKEEKKDWLM